MVTPSLHTSNTIEHGYGLDGRKNKATSVQCAQIPTHSLYSVQTMDGSMITGIINMFLWYIDGIVNIDNKIISAEN